MHTIPDALTDRPFTLSEARAHGLSRRVLDGRRFRRVFHGVYAVADLLMTHRLWLIAALLVAPKDAVISHRSALHLFGLELRSGDDGLLHLSTRLRAISREPRIFVHRRLHPIAVREIDGLPVTAPERTFVDCAMQLSLVQLVVTADWLIHQGLTTFDDLLRYCHERHLDGVVAGRRALRHVVERAESPMESLVRLMLVFAGLPEPVCNREVRDAEGVFVARPDLSYWQYKVAVEYDGVWHAASREQRERDRNRREYLEREGWIVVVIIDEDLQRPWTIPQRVHARLVERGYRGPRPAIDPQWRRMFRPGCL